MEDRQPTSPPSFGVTSCGRSHGSFHSSDRQPSHSPHPSRSPSRLSSSRSTSIAIPGSSKGPLAPPPLPPPRHVPGLQENHDVAWQWGNIGLRGGRASRPVSPHSRPWSRRESNRPDDDEPGMQEHRRRESSSSTIRSPRSVEAFEYDQRDEGYASLSGSSFAQSVSHFSITSLEMRTRGAAVLAFQREHGERCLNVSEGTETTWANASTRSRKSG